MKKLQNFIRCSFPTFSEPSFLTHHASEFMDTKAIKRQRHTWTQEEDKILKFLVEEKKITNWVIISGYFNNRSNKDCRDHYLFQLSPNIVKRKWTVEEEAFLLEKYNELGAKWVKLTSFFEGRSPNDLKNRIKLIQQRKNPLRKRILTNIQLGTNNQTSNSVESPLANFSISEFIKMNINVNGLSPQKPNQNHAPTALPKNEKNDTNPNSVINKSEIENHQSIFDFDAFQFEEEDNSMNSMDYNLFSEW